LSKAHGRTRRVLPGDVAEFAEFHHFIGELERVLVVELIEPHEVQLAQEQTGQFGVTVDPRQPAMGLNLTLLGRAGAQGAE
jgi:hypothetical protein